MTSTTPVKKSMLTNELYDALKFIAQIALPALGTLYFALAGIWNLPNATQVIGTLTAIDVFLGVLLGLSTTSYVKSESRYDGALVVDTSDPNKDSYSLEFSTPLNDLPNLDSVTLKVNNAS